MPGIMKKFRVEAEVMLQPEELAIAFNSMNAEEMAKFFNELGLFYSVPGNRKLAEELRYQVRDLESLTPEGRDAMYIA